MTEIVRSEIQTPTRGAVIWGVPMLSGSIWFKRKWAAKHFIAALDIGEGPQALEDLKANGMIEWIEAGAV